MGWTRRLSSALLAGALLAGLASPDPAFAQGKSESRGADSDEAARLEKEVQALAGEGQFDTALPLAERVLALRKQALPAGDVKIGSAMGDLGALHLLLNDHLRAEPLLEGAALLIEKAKPDSKELALALLNLASLYRARGETRGAALVDRAITLHEKIGGPDNPDLGSALRQRASMLGRAPEAKKLLQRARAIHEKARDERQVVIDILSLARFERADKASTEAVNLYNEAIPRAEKAYGPDHPQMITVHLAVADFWRREGSQDKRQFEKASAAYQRAERVVLKVFGPKHTRLAEVYSEWSLCAQAQNDMPRAIELRTKANDIEENHLASVLASGSEQVKQGYLNKLAAHADDTVALHLWGDGQRAINDQAAARLALTTILRRKGRVLDAVAQGVTGLSARMSSEDKKLLTELNKVRSDLSSMMIRGPGATSPTDYQARLNALSARATAIEVQVSASSAALRVETTPITLEAVQAAIPEDAALVEIYRYNHRNAKAYSASVESEGGFTTKYAGYVLRRNGPVRAMYFEESGLIENVVNQFRGGLADPERRDVGDPAWRLYQMTISRIEPLFGDAKRILISPDGALNLVPFAAMLDVKHKFLAERWAFSYLSSGRDLLRFKIDGGAGKQPIVIANPDYDAGGAAAGGNGGGSTRSGDLSRAKFSALPGTQGEADAIHKIIPKAAMYTAAAATEATLKQVHGPEFLHIATHGFFLANTSKDQRGSRALVLEKDVPAAERPTFRIKDPLLRSGLALAGANVKRGGDDDGILTALEASGLDLHGTKMVVLSACETGIGELSYGEGVFGLRRALVIAGSETQVMSLWKVDDDATRQLMSSYYEELMKGAGRSEAMRDVQLAMMKNKDTAHPFYWASFIVSGNPGPLGVRGDSGAPSPDGSKGGGSVPSVAPGARGCGCEVAGQPRGGALLPLAAAALISIRRRRTPRRERRVCRAGYRPGPR
jgi:MYXO-CTERM domain-containing protein